MTGGGGNVDESMNYYEGFMLQHYYDVCVRLYTSMGQQEYHVAELGRLIKGL